MEVSFQNKSLITCILISRDFINTFFKQIKINIVLRLKKKLIEFESFFNTLKKKKKIDNS